MISHSDSKIPRVVVVEISNDPYLPPYYSLPTTVTSAMRDVESYVRERWNEYGPGADGQRMPENNLELIHAFFTDSGESYQLLQKNVNDYR